jgi:hypothetical protein
MRRKPPVFLFFIIKYMHLIYRSFEISFLSSAYNYEKR